jgi:uncharacterized protein
MLALKPNCECCDTDIVPDGNAAFICTFECTFCAPCALGRLRGVCPTCKGNLTPRPVRTADALLRFPAQTKRAAIKAQCLLLE